MATRKKRDSTGRTAPASEVVDPKEFRKTNETIGLRVMEGRLSLLTRKVFNVMMYHAQQLRVPGDNAPIDTPAAKKYFWILLSDLARDAAYDSKDTEYLKQQLDELQNIKLLMENERQWTSERLVASVTLVNPHGLNKHSGQVWFGYAFPPEVHELVMAPGTYTRFSIFYQGLLRSGSALALYEVCRRYATNPSKVTASETYEHWFGVLTGNPVARNAEPTPYKYFKRDVIKPAIAEINTLTDITVELIEHKNGRRVERLQFRVEQNKQPQLGFPSQPILDMALMARVVKFGFTQSDASDFLAQHGEEKIRACAAFVEARLAQKNSAQLESPAAYFRWSLKEGNAAAQELAQPAQSPPAPLKRKSEGPTVMERFLSARAQEAMTVYKELDEVARNTVFERFKLSHTNFKSLKLERGVESPMVRSLFTHWYAKDLWGEPTAQGLANYVEQFGMNGLSSH
ncbi:replication initiation protein [Polaromonas hydrogenivorans]|uniref:Replication initiation protein n=1 Tax=Polaromonas hydrogenivorans TaxID=335476 RepID=A0AAU7LYC2_9BURK